MKIIVLFLCGISATLNGMNETVKNRVKPLRLLALYELIRQKKVYSGESAIMVQEVVCEHFYELNKTMQTDCFSLLSLHEQGRYKREKIKNIVRESDSGQFQGIVARNIEYHNFFSRINQQREATRASDSKSTI